MPGNENSGRKDALLEAKLKQFKHLAWDRIVKLAKASEESLDKYIELFASKLMPQQTELSGPGGEDLKLGTIEKQLILISNGTNFTGEEMSRTSENVLPDTKWESISFSEGSVSDISNDIRENEPAN